MFHSMTSLSYLGGLAHIKNQSSLHPTEVMYRLETVAHLRAREKVEETNISIVILTYNQPLFMYTYAYYVYYIYLCILLPSETSPRNSK